ncbi:hypothetical protein [Nocardia brasiliensis]|uniref:hypothetical protein n=1 Tax=Nocardia brasiliensis TaxID=37326 RepID=UPI001EEA2C96|nr:hypothetical protein [Nocardia brasiliensis]
MAWRLGWTIRGSWSRTSCRCRFFVELGLELEGETVVVGQWVDQLVGLGEWRANVAFLRVPDGSGRIELPTFQHPCGTP